MATNSNTSNINSNIEKRNSSDGTFLKKKKKRGMRIDEEDSKSLINEKK